MDINIYSILRLKYFLISLFNIISRLSRQSPCYPPTHQNVQNLCKFKIESWVKADFKRKQVRAMKTIQKDEEIVVNYRDYEEFNFGSREYRQYVLLGIFAFICSCSECSLEGEDLLENERIRAEIREKERRKFSNPGAFDFELGQNIVNLVKKLDLRLEFVNQLLNTFDAAKCAQMFGMFTVDPDMNILENEAMKYCQQFGDSELNHFNKRMKMWKKQR